MSQGVVRIEYDVLDSVVRAMNASPDDAYWARRLGDLVRDPASAAKLSSALVVAIERWVAHDPSYFVHERLLSEQLAVWSWPRELLEALDERLLGGGRIEDRALAHLVMGRLWLEARRPPEDMLEFYARAVAHLREVDHRLRIGAWHEAMCEALSVVDPDELARSSNIVDSAAPSSRDRALLAILRGAARSANWDLYDAYRQKFGLLDPDSARRSSEIVRLDGQRAEHDFVYGPRVAERSAPLCSRGLRPIEGSAPRAPHEHSFLEHSCSRGFAPRAPHEHSFREHSFLERSFLERSGETVTVRPPSRSSG